MRANDSYLPRQKQLRAQQQAVQEQPAAPYYQLETVHSPQQQTSALNISQFIWLHMPEKYERIDNIMKKKKEKDRQISLHHSRGTRLASGQNYVLEFDMAGSGFRQFRSDHMNIDGQQNSLVDYMQIPQTLRFTKALRFIPGVRSYLKQRELDKAYQKREDASAKDQLTETERYNLETVANWEKKIGSTPYRDAETNQTMKHIHEKKKGNKTRITMAGPLAMNGMMNAGEHRIDNLSNYILTIAQEYLTSLFAQWESQEKATPQQSPPTIWLRLRGHSRGAVATIEGAMMIRHWLKSDPLASSYADQVKFDIIQFDPVPGFGSRSGTHERIDLTGSDSLPPNMAPLDENAETTVVYSMHTQYPFFFTPQEVEHTNRIIFVPFSHSVGLEQVDTHASSQEKERHRAAFIDAASMEAFRLSSLNELNQGVYVMDEDNILFRMNNSEECGTILEKIYEGANLKLQKDRHDLVKRVAETWFKANSSPEQKPST